MTGMAGAFRCPRSPRQSPSSRDAALCGGGGHHCPLCITIKERGLSPLGSPSEHARSVLSAGNERPDGQTDRRTLNWVRRPGSSASPPPRGGFGQVWGHAKAGPSRLALTSRSELSQGHVGPGPCRAAARAAGARAGPPASAPQGSAAPREAPPPPLCISPQGCVKGPRRAVVAEWGRLPALCSPVP